MLVTDNNFTTQLNSLYSLQWTTFSIEWALWPVESSIFKSTSTMYPVTIWFSALYKLYYTASLLYTVYSGLFSRHLLFREFRESTANPRKLKSWMWRTNEEKEKRKNEGNVLHMQAAKSMTCMTDSYSDSVSDSNRDFGWPDSCDH